MLTVLIFPKRQAFVLLRKTTEREAKITGRIKLPEMKKSAKYYEISCTNVKDYDKRNKNWLPN